MPYKDPERQREYHKNRYKKISQDFKNLVCRDCSILFRSKVTRPRCYPCQRLERKLRDPKSIQRRDRVRNNEKYKKYLANLIELKSNPCTDCGNIFPHYKMVFDHVPERGTKLMNISTAVCKFSLTNLSLQEELAKCDLVCANCHSARTYFRKNPEEVNDVRSY